MLKDSESADDPPQPQVGAGRALRRRLLRRVAYLRRNRCSVLLAGLLMFILVHPLVADSAIGAVFLALGTLSILLVACGHCTRAVARS